MMLLFYIRHGEPTYDPDALTYLGHKQAEAIAKRLALFGVDRIFSSTSTRAVQTAQPLANMLRKEITQLDFCHEDHAYEEFSLVNDQGRTQWGYTTPKILRLFASEEVRKLDKEWYNASCFPPNGFRRGVERVRRETDAFLASLGYEHLPEQNLYRVICPNEERIALFAHEGFGHIFLSTLLDIPYPLYCTHFGMHHTGMTVIEFEDMGGFSIPRALMVGNDGHLYKEGLPLNYYGRRF